MAEVSLALSYPELFQVTGPLPSLVLRTEDMWWRHNQCHRSERGSQSGFPLLTPIAPFQGDLVTWRHFVRASRGQLSFLLSSWPVNRVYGGTN